MTVFNWRGFSFLSCKSIFTYIFIQGKAEVISDKLYKLYCHQVSSQITIFLKCKKWRGIPDTYLSYLSNLSKRWFWNLITKVFKNLLKVKLSKNQFNKIERDFALTILPYRQRLFFYNCGRLPTGYSILLYIFPYLTLQIYINILLWPILKRGRVRQWEMEKGLKNYMCYYSCLVCLYF